MKCLSGVARETAVRSGATHSAILENRAEVPCCLLLGRSSWGANLKGKRAHYVPSTALPDRGRAGNVAVPFLRVRSDAGRAVLVGDVLLLVHHSQRPQPPNR